MGLAEKVDGTAPSRGPSPARLLRRYILAGLLVIVPAALTIWIFWVLFNKVDGILRDILARYIGRTIPGLGFVAVLVLVLVAGMMASNLVGRRLVSWGDGILARLPLMSRMYTAVKQISEVFLSDRGTVFSRAILIEYPRRGIYSVAFVTAEQQTYLKDRQATCATYHVFLPTTPNPTSGFFLVVPQEDAVPLDMSIEDALKLVISAGAVIPTRLGARAALEGESGVTEPPDG